MKILILGLGRMGQRYVSTFKNQFGADMHLTTVDPQNPEIEANQRFTDITQIPTTQTFDLAVDARPNRQRFETLKALVARKIPKIIVEKPHAGSLSESQKMRDLIASATHSEVMIPFYRRYSPIFDPKTLNKLDAGNLVHISMTAGAIGLGCNGVHLLDAANHLFHSTPTSVMASLNLNSIESPRGPEFLDHGGTLVVEYSHRRKLTLNILNMSSAGATSAFYFENGKILMNENQNSFWKWYRRSSENQALPMYRTHMDQEVAPPFDYNLNLFQMMEEGISSFLKDASTSPSLEEAHTVLETIALAIESSESGQIQRWPIEGLQSKLGELRFNFT